MGARIRFGTDGWRGIIAQDFTYDNVRACAQGVADYLAREGMADSGLVVGYDTRFASEHFAQAVAEVLAGNGIKSYLCDKAVPTPVVSYNIVVLKTAGAVVITASHNPANWNGFKFKSQYAGSASPDVVATLENHIAKVLESGKVGTIPLEQGLKDGVIEHIDPAPSYMSHISTLVDLEPIKRAGLRIVVDSMYGVGAGYFHRLIEGGTTRVTEINGERNPLFPGIQQPEPIAQNLTRLSGLIKEEGADVGLATDGDADRLGMVDEKGDFISPLQIFGLLALYLLEVRRERGAMVKSLTTTRMIQHLGELYGVPVFETPVGFKHIGPVMIRENALIGGEESGGFGFRGHIPERDGILSGLYILDLMVKLGKKPSELIQYLYDKVGPHYYDRIDIHFDASCRQSILHRMTNSRPKMVDGYPVASVDSTDGWRILLQDGSWLLMRFSGTEPLLRIYAESQSPERVKRLIEFGESLAGL